MHVLRLRFYLNTVMTVLYKEKRIICYKKNKMKGLYQHHEDHLARILRNKTKNF